MSFNPLITCIAARLPALLPDAPSVIELGNQTFNADNRSLEFAIEAATGQPGADVDALRELLATPAEQRRDATGRYYRALGFSSYQAIDINDRYGSLIMDLNYPLDTHHDYHEQFDLVTNNGTGEHVFDQHAVFYNCHTLTRPGGLMLHIMPFVEYINHGFYSFHPNLYYALAKANNYRLLAMGVATRSGEGVVAVPEGESPPQLFRRQDNGTLRTFLADSKPARTGLAGSVAGMVKRLANSSDGQRFNNTIRDLQRIRPKLLLMTLLQRTTDAPFRKPIQIRYEDDFGDTALAGEYR